MRVAVIADDLTGALDTAAPFAACGASVAVATAPQHLPEVLRRGDEVVVVNTRSRHLPDEAAARVVRDCAEALAGHRPTIAFKKVDSRLKGPVAAEVAAALAAFGRQRVLFSPAVPDQGRFVRDGRLEGRGVAEPVPLSGILPGAVIADAPDAAALARAVAAALDADDMLLVGARGLGIALTRVLWPVAAAPAPAPLPEGPVVIAIGSRDPITREQVERLRADCPSIVVEAAPDGEFTMAPRTGRLRLMIATEGSGRRAEAEVAAAFADGLVRRLADCASLIASGGDTALAILDRLGVRAVRPRGEAAPGLPLVDVSTPHGTLAVVTKSGGFGMPDTLAKLFRRPGRRRAAWA